MLALGYKAATRNERGWSCTNCLRHRGQRRLRSPLRPITRCALSARGSEYFRIWIVNLLLTIVTLGIYSAWAKVRRLKYMYRNTQIADSSFDYHGSPIAILKGRLIALVLLIAYNFSFQSVVDCRRHHAGVLAAIFPWLIRQSLRFRARYSSYRGIHFQFVGGLAEIYLIAAPLIFFIVPFALLGFYAEERGGEPPMWLVAFLGLAMLIYLAGVAVFALPIQTLSAQQHFTGVRRSAVYRNRGPFLCGLWNFASAILLVIGLVFAAVGFRRRRRPFQCTTKGRASSASEYWC